MHACDRQTDRQTDGQTEFSSLDRVCILCSAVKTSAIVTKQQAGDTLAARKSDHSVWANSRHDESRMADVYCKF